MIWSGLPTELQTLIFAHMITQPLIHGTHAETVRAHGTVRLLCHGGLCLADNLIDTQLCLPSRPHSPVDLGIDLLVRLTVSVCVCVCVCVVTVG